MVRSTVGLQSRAAEGLGKPVPSTLQRYNSSAITMLSPAESPETIMFDVETSMLSRC